ncbi:MAG: hypothetical protein ABF838_13980, partial [Lentilactobacillus hilgardii]
LCLVLLILYVIVGYVGFKNDENELILRCFRMIAFITMILGTFVISIVGDGDADLAKHLIMVPLTINLIILEIFSDVLQQTFWHPLQSRRNSSDEPNKQS